MSTTGRSPSLEDAAYIVGSFETENIVILLPDDMKIGRGVPDLDLRSLSKEGSIIADVEGGITAVVPINFDDGSTAVVATYVEDSDLREGVATSWLILAALGLIVVIGGLTRLTDSGLSITTWNVVSGILPPLNNNQWNDVFNLYKEIPQFYLLNQNMLKKNDYGDIQVNDITLNVSKVLPKWIGLIQKNENELLHLYPKIFLTMLIKCLNYAYEKGEESPFGYLLITATKK